MIEIQNLSVGYEKSPLHKSFSLKIFPGEFLALIGPNGSGKSTILKTLIKEIPPVHGAVFLDGKNLTSINLKELAKEISLLLTVNVKPEIMTAREVVASGRYPHTGYFAILGKEDNLKIEEAIEMVKAGDFADKNFMQLSDGQKQRILFARALCQDTKILILDEPTSYLDIKWRLEMMAILKDLTSKNLTVIASLHEIDLALKFSDRILCVGKEIQPLSWEYQVCRQQITSLYDLKNNFFEEEKAYSQYLKNFCERSQNKESSSSSPKKEAPSPQKKKASPIMIQGTMSSAGKSFISAAFCRLFARSGFKVSPFKSQNMALNSFVTKEGLEMGRAQVMQAQAAGIEPSVLMNPILLKPTSDVGSQVIVNGEVVACMKAKEYFAYKKSLIPQIKKAYDTLAEKNDIMVIEGAGSPAEINLKENDIVNMGMAELADSPVLLVCDIDRGGVFAQLLGTVDLLTPEERKRVKGFIINKFRGDKSILDSGIKMIEEKTGIPVLGTVPYIKIQLDDEDSLSESLNTSSFYGSKKDCIQLALIRLPHISNFTDFIPLQNHPFYNVYYVSRKEELGSPDGIILPGTKNTLSDLQWLRDSGLADLIIEEGKKGSIIGGICGGFQMLGEKIIGREDGSENKSVTEALSLLPLETEFTQQKTRTRVSGEIICNTGLFSALNHEKVTGYEIHMGKSRFLPNEKEDFFSQIKDEVSGEEKKDGAFKNNVFGTYIHGFFDESGICNKLAQIIAREKNIDLSKISLDENFNLSQFKEKEYNLLADSLSANIDMNKIYEIMGIKEDESKF